MYNVEFAADIDNITYLTLGKRYRAAEIIQNTMISEFKGRLFSFLQSSEFRTLRNMESSHKRTESFKELEKNFGLNQSSYDKSASKYQNHYKKHIDSHCVQKIGIRVKKSIDDYRFKNGKDIHYIKKGSLSTIEGKDYLTGIRYNVNSRTVEWLGIKLKLNVRHDDIYLQTILDEIETDHINNVEPWIAKRNALQADNRRLKKQGLPAKDVPKRPNCKLRFVSIKRKWVRNKFKYYVQFTINGIPPFKFDKNTGDIKHKAAVGKTAGIDLGVSTAAVVNENMNMVFEPLSNRSNDILDKKIVKLQRRISLKSRFNNPDNYNEDGTCKKGKKTWVISKNHRKLLNKLKNLHRISASCRKVNTNILANKLISYGTIFKVEAINMRALQKRSRKTEVSKKTGRFKRKKRFGKSLLHNAPSAFKQTLKDKAERYGGSVTEINTVKVKASQFSHITCKCKKKPLSQRWNTFSYNNKTLKIQRDLYSSYLILNTNAAGDKIDISKCNNNFDKFIENHNILIDLLAEQKQDGIILPSCMGI